jgi:hypothetical protein
MLAQRPCSVRAQLKACLVRLLLILLAFCAAACTTPLRSYDFPPTPAGAATAGERILAAPQDTYANFTVVVRREPLPGPQASFLDLGRFSIDRAADPSSEANHRVCELTGAPPGCDPVFDAVFLHQRDASGAPYVHFEPTLEGARAGRAAYREGGARDRPYILIVHGSMRTTARYVWRWAEFTPEFMTFDFVCGLSTAQGCQHRLDIRRVAVVPRQDFTTPEFEPVDYLRPVGPDLRAAYDAAARVAGEGDKILFEYLAYQQTDMRHDGTVFEVTEISDAFCGRMRLSSRPGWDETHCLDYQEIDRFVVRDFARTTGQVAMDVAARPFRFLGAVGALVAMGAPGG